MAFSARTLSVIFLLMCIIAITLPKANCLRCLPCDASTCKDPTGCNNGFTKDICNCCNRCAKGPGEECGGTWGELGACSEGFNCLKKTVNSAGQCVPNDQWVPPTE